MLHYHDFRTNLDGQMGALAARLGIDVPTEPWVTLVEAATFASMRRDSARIVPSTGIWKEQDGVFKRPRSGAWRDLLDDDDEEIRRPRHPRPPPLVPDHAHLLLEASAEAVKTTEHGQFSNQLTAVKDVPLLVLGADVLVMRNREPSSCDRLVRQGWRRPRRSPWAADSAPCTRSRPRAGERSPAGCRHPEAAARCSSSNNS